MILARCFAANEEFGIIRAGGQLDQISPTRILHLVENASTNGAIFKIYRNGKRVLGKHCRQHLPLPDESIDEYSQRLRKMGCDEFLLYLSPIAETNLSDSETRFYAELVEALRSTGRCFSRIDIELFFGWYSRTAGGVHSEDCSNFHVVVSGKKTMHLWRPATINQNDYEVKRQGSELYLVNHPSEPSDAALEGDALDVIYWPARYWHVGTSLQPTLAMNFAIY